MKKFLFFLLLLSIYSLRFTNFVFATSKNIFGLHLTQTQDLESAAKIINSSGGDWGYATIVIRLDQLDKNTWQDFFDKCRELHVIPLVRLSTLMENSYWKRPSTSDIDNLANFLNSLNWPTTTQHVIIFNEINHATEWGGGVDVKNFTDISIYTYQKFKSLNPNFYLLSSPLDLAAPEKPDQFKSAAAVYKEIYLYKPEYFQNFDALASHYYPHNSPKNYQWELSLIKSLGINKTYPIFITETAWPHREGESKNNSFYTVDTSAKLLSQAISAWSKDSRVEAVTPFIYNYPHEPFEHFSWVDAAEKLYPSYQKLVDLPKVKNTPVQKTDYKIILNNLPVLLLSGVDYSGKLTLKNTGQSIWGETQFCLNPESTPNVTLDAICTTNELVYPGHNFTFNYKVKINANSDFKDKTFISWQGLSPLEIAPVNSSGTIYSPRTTPLQKLRQFFQNLFI